MTRNGYSARNNDSILLSIKKQPVLVDRIINRIEIRNLPIRPLYHFRLYHSQLSNQHSNFFVKFYKNGIYEHSYFEQIIWLLISQIFLFLSILPFLLDSWTLKCERINRFVTTNCNDLCKFYERKKNCQDFPLSFKTASSRVNLFSHRSIVGKKKKNPLRLRFYRFDLDS